MAAVRSPNPPEQASRFASVITSERVRLGTCIALELLCVAGTGAGLWLVASRGVETAGRYLQPEASAATSGARGEYGRFMSPLARAHLEVKVPSGETTVFGLPDEMLLAPLAATQVTGVKLNHGGTSLSLRLDFASGARAAFKPQQTHPQSDPRREIAAYRIDRMLGIGHVPPAKSATFLVADLIAAAAPDARDYTEQRIATEAIAHDGKVVGEVSWWIPQVSDMMIGAHRVDEPLGMADWMPMLQAGTPTPPEFANLVAQLSTVVVFDVLIDNADRWSGNNTKCSPDQQVLFIMDNTLSFTNFTHGHQSNLLPLQRISKFSRTLVKRLRTLTYASIAQGLTVPDDPLAPLLEPGEIRALLARRDHLLGYIDALSAELGENSVLALP